MTHQDYECPKCGDWINIDHETHPEHFNCPWCNEPLTLSVDYDNSGMSNQRNLTRLISNREHVERMIEHAQETAEGNPQEYGDS